MIGFVESGEESEVVAAFVGWLNSEGRRGRTEVAWADVVAERAGERLVAETKRITAAPGLDLDTLYGQLLRRMTSDPATRYAAVVPEKLVNTARRVHKRYETCCASIFMGSRWATRFESTEVES